MAGCKEQIALPYIMEQKIKKMQALFNGTGPSVKLFKAKLSKMTEEEQKKQVYELYQLAFGSYEKIPAAYRKFIDEYLKSDREGYADFLINHSPLGKLRYQPHFPWLFLKMLHFLETTEWKGRIYYKHLATATTLSFNLPEKVSSIPKLTKYIRNVRLLAEEFLRLIGKIDIGDDDYK